MLGASGPRSETALVSRPPQAYSVAQPGGPQLLHVPLQGSVSKRERAGLTYSLLARCPGSLLFRVCSVTRHGGTRHLQFHSLLAHLPIVQGTEPQRGAEMGAGAQVFSPNFLLTSLHLSLFLSLRDGLTWRPASPEGMRALQ